MPERTPNQAASKPSPSSTPRGTKTTGDQRIPKKTAHLDSAADIKSFVRKILLASPMFPRLYADVVLSSAPNSNEAKILAQNYKKIIATTERTSKAMSSSKSCMHIKVTGVRCGSPSMRGEQFCYFHQRMLRTVRGPASRVHHAALLEDDESIQASLIETVNALLQGTIELKRAELVLRALNTAVRNIRRVRFGMDPELMVKEIPDYPTPPLEQVDEKVRRGTPPPREARRGQARLRRRRRCTPSRVSQGRASNSRQSGRRDRGQRCARHCGSPGLSASPLVWGRVFDPSRRPRSTGPQRTATQARPNQNCRSSAAQASSQRESGSAKRKDKDS